MRYLITVPFLSPGSGLSRYIFSLCKLLSADNEVYVLTTHNTADTSYEQSEINNCNSNIGLISLGLKSKILKYFTVLKWIKRIRPDVIVNNFNAVIQYILPLLSRKIKFVHVLHADVPDFYRIGNINAKYTDAWIAPTIAVAIHFNELTNNKYHSLVKVIPHGVSESKSVGHQTGNTLELVFAGVLSTHKGAQHLPAICKLLKEKDVDFRLTIIGDGFLKENLQSAFAEQIRTGRVKLTGVISHEQVYEFMSKSDIFLYPTNCDSFGLVIAEAMMNGAVPVVGLLPGVTDTLIDDGRNGYLVAPQDVESFVEKILQLYKNHSKLSDMRNEAMLTARTRFSESVMSANYIKFLKTLDAPTNGAKS